MRASKRRPPAAAAAPASAPLHFAMKQGQGFHMLAEQAISTLHMLTYRLQLRVVAQWLAQTAELACSHAREQRAFTCESKHTAGMGTPAAVRYPTTKGTASAASNSSQLLSCASRSHGSTGLHQDDAAILGYLQMAESLGNCTREITPNLQPMYRRNITVWRIACTQAGMNKYQTRSKKKP